MNTLSSLLIKCLFYKLLPRLLFLPAFLIITPVLTDAQNIDVQKKFLHFQYMGVNEGLSQGTIFRILQESRGYMWFGTEYGLNRYDGYSFKKYINNPTDSLSISHNNVLSIIEDSTTILVFQKGNVIYKTGVISKEELKSVLNSLLNDDINFGVNTKDIRY